MAGSRSAVGSPSDSCARGPEFDTRPGHIFLFLLPLNLEEKLSVKVVVHVITNVGQRQKSASNTGNITDLPKTLQVPSLCWFS